MKYEERALARAGIADVADLACCGPGPDAIVRWAETEGVGRSQVILAGLAGSLRETMRPGEAFVISTVTSPTGRHFRCDVSPPAEDAGEKRVRRAVVASAETILTTPQAKEAWAEKTGADLVDLESAVFAEAAAIFGWRWVIVRGVSDGPGEGLPHGIEHWLDQKGSVRPGRIAWSLAIRPWSIPMVLRIRRHAREAMANVAAILKALLDDDEKRKGTPADATSAVDETGTVH